MNKWQNTDKRVNGRRMVTCKCEGCNKDIFERSGRQHRRKTNLCIKCFISINKKSGFKMSSLKNRTQK